MCCNADFSCIKFSILLRISTVIEIRGEIHLSQSPCPPKMVFVHQFWSVNLSLGSLC